MQAKAMNMKTGKALERSAAMRSSISCSSGRWPESPARGRGLEALLAGVTQGRVVDMADLAARKNGRCCAWVLHQQALAQRPDEDEQSNDGQQEGAQQAQYRTVHGWFPFSSGGMSSNPWVDVTQVPYSGTVL
jgi:hypothetical protein